ncbi:aryl-sulfate sulfotransferase [Marmoricola sp. RAF53]|uniref:aryl-sulfate sulfotransferase n=1 Tax=Marmoricola sp. RAF53 TaxID=3233059 RepID=UPI003F94AA21
MKRTLAALVVLSASVLTATTTGLAAPAGATPVPVRTLSVSGTEVDSYPAFSSGVHRYAATTTAATAGVLQVAAATSDPAGSVRVDGRTVTGPTTVSGLVAGDEVSVVIADTAGTEAYSVMYLPAGFPKLEVTTHQSGLADGYVGLTLNPFDASGRASYDAIVDRNGVPVYAALGTAQNLDLKQQPNGQITVSRPTTAPGHTGTALITLDSQLREAGRQDVLAPLTNTDGHDAVKLADGSTILIGYEYDAGRDKTDATIQKLAANGTTTFEWTSKALEAETTASPTVQNNGGFSRGDYAHINSVVPVADGDVIASFRHLSAVVRIATVAHDGYQPGDIVWKLGGRDSDFTFVDDPYGGPCAQHTASELANGHILIFDNGSDGLCVDPTDPTGPTTNRGATRISEYALDTTAHTATLVWSYAPASTYALFAGSARRTANGDTLIGWADDRDAIATEIGPDKQVLWELRDPAAATPTVKHYMTYRAELITNLPDAIKPTARLGTVAASYRQGTVVPVDSSCTDRGGSNLRTCTVTGLSGGNLDTRTPGTRTARVTATDGAGNVTTTARTYTVVPPYGVDAAAGTVRLATHGRHGRASGSVAVRNTGYLTGAVRLLGTKASKSFDVRYYAGSTDVTRRVVAGTYRSASLAPNATVRLRVVVIRKPGTATGKQQTVTVRATSAAAASAVDRVAMVVTARR